MRRLNLMHVNANIYITWFNLGLPSDCAKSQRNGLFIREALGQLCPTRGPVEDFVRPSWTFSFLCMYSRGAHTFSACELLLKWPCQNDLPTTKMQNIYLFSNVLRIICTYNVCWCTLHNQMSQYCKTHMLTMFQGCERTLNAVLWAHLFSSFASYMTWTIANYYNYERIITKLHSHGTQF